MIDTASAAASFGRTYGAAAQVFCQAPGRVNLIGEHIDYAGGQVLPFSLDKGVTVAAVRGEAGRVRVHSDQYLDAGVAEVDPNEAPPERFTRFVHELALATGTSGADLCVFSDLPLERGWSSSAAFAVAVAGALLALEPHKERLTGAGLAQLCQRAEQAALGVACGLMDQYVSIYGQLGQAVLFDTQALSHRYIPLNLGAAALLVIDSGQPRRLAESGYNQRRQELEQGFKLLQARLGEFTAFRDVPHDALLKEIQRLPEPLNMRLRHLVTEQRRVEQAAQHLARGEMLELGQLITASHHSLSDDYEVSTPELDQLVSFVDGKAGVYGARLVGGGFGGGILALVAREVIEQRVLPAIADYEAATGLKTQWDEAWTGQGAQLSWPGSEPQALANWLS